MKIDRLRKLFGGTSANPTQDAPKGSSSRPSGGQVELPTRTKSSQAAGTAGRSANPQQGASRSRLEQLPLELIGQVVAHLDSPVDHAALVLASPELHAKVMGSFLPGDTRKEEVDRRLHGFNYVMRDPFSLSDRLVNALEEDVGNMPRLASDAQLARMTADIKEQLRYPDELSPDPRYLAARLAGSLIASPRVDDDTKRSLAAAIHNPETEIREADLREGMGRALRGVLIAQPGARAEAFAPLTAVIDEAKKRTIRNPRAHNPYRGLAVLDRDLRRDLPKEVVEKVMWK